MRSGDPSLKRKPPPSKPEPDPTLTGAEIVALLEINERTLARWFDAGLAKRGDGWRDARVKYRDLLEFVYKRNPVGENPEGSDSPALERVRLADAIRKERLNSLEEKTLLKADEVRRQVRAIAHALRAQLETLVRTRPDLEAELRAAFETAAGKIEKDFEVKGDGENDAEEHAD